MLLDLFVCRMAVSNYNDLLYHLIMG